MDLKVEPQLSSKDLFLLYKHLYDYLGPQYWWPGETKEEISIGAILTQNTTWKNVEKAIENLKREGLLDFKKILELDKDYLAQLIKPSGYYNQKAQKLKNFAEFMLKEFGGKFDVSIDKWSLREKLLSVKGVGKETADSIILYAFEKPIFVVDAYTKRILLRHGVIESDKIEYDEIAKLFYLSIPEDVKIYNEYHALFVNIGKNYCSKRTPKCNECPIKKLIKD